MCRRAMDTYSYKHLWMLLQSDYSCSIKNSNTGFPCNTHKTSSSLT